MKTDKKPSAYATCLKLAQERHHEAFNDLLSALRKYRSPLPHLPEYQSKEARLMVSFLEVLLDQLYPRNIWQKIYDELPNPE